MYTAVIVNKKTQHKHPPENRLLRWGNFYLLEIADVLLNLCEAWRLFMQLPLQSYHIYVLLYIGPATEIAGYTVLDISDY